jgi:hypothetical protein
LDKNILLVTSEESRATGKDLVSFHKSFRLVFNAEVLATTGIKKDWWADIISVDKDRRRIKIKFYSYKNSPHNRKVGDPLFSKTAEYLAICTTQLLWEFELCPFGAFEYTWFWNHRIMIIKF